jgi:alpha-1,3-mannosyltransferase
MLLYMKKLYDQLGNDDRFDTWVFLPGLVVAELSLCCWIISHVPYTEIDWIAYMQEVTTWYDKGEYNYQNIRGDTGPLVYPAGFLYLFQLLRYWTDEQVSAAQYIFLTFYMLNQTVVLLIYYHCLQSLRPKWAVASQNKPNNNNVHFIWMWRIGMVSLCLSKRLHSIFVLRLFNDGPTMLLFYISVWLFMHHYWNAGCVLFSLAVSVKMNVLLFAPGLLLLLLQQGPTVWTVFWRLALGCALPQLLLGAPFLLRFPISYLRKAFELDRVFFYQWTVNWKMLPENMFVSQPWALILLMGHVGTLIVFAIRWCRHTAQQTKHGQVMCLGSQQQPHQLLSPEYICHTLFTSNFIGIVFARTLHYQFYVRTLSFFCLPDVTTFCVIISLFTYLEMINFL